MNPYRVPGNRPPEPPVRVLAVEPDPFPPTYAGTLDAIIWRLEAAVQRGEVVQRRSLVRCSLKTCRPSCPDPTGRHNAAMRYLSKLVHAIAHAFGLNARARDAWWENETLVEGHRCLGCGRRSGSPVPTGDLESWGHP